VRRIGICVPARNEADRHRRLRAGLDSRGGRGEMSGAGGDRGRQALPTTRRAGPVGGFGKRPADAGRAGAGRLGRRCSRGRDGHLDKQIGRCRQLAGHHRRRLPGAIRSAHRAASLRSVRSWRWAPSMSAAGRLIRASCGLIRQPNARSRGLTHDRVHDANLGRRQGDRRVGGLTPVPRMRMSCWSMRLGGSSCRSGGRRSAR
jgi:hypothetical protein